MVEAGVKSGMYVPTRKSCKSARHGVKKNCDVVHSSNFLAVRNSEFGTEMTGSGGMKAIYGLIRKENRISGLCTQVQGWRLTH